MGGDGQRDMFAGSLHFLTHNPGILGDAAVLVGKCKATRLGRAARQTAGHHFVAVFGANEVGSQCGKARLDVSIDEGGRGGKADFFLRYVLRRIGADFSFELFELRSRKRMAVDGAIVAVAIHFLDNETGKVFQHKTTLLLLPAPPGCH